MTAEALLASLVRIELVASVAILLVLALRPWALRWLGANVTYWLWLVVPIAAAAGSLPARERIVLTWPPTDVSALPAWETSHAAENPPRPAERASVQIAATRSDAVSTLADALLAVWAVGAGALLARSIRNTRRLAADPSVGPALIGVLRPKLLLPVDFETRFDAQERALILAHEETHRVSGHTLVNALVEVARCAQWFNPLVHIAARRIRMDQELACDAAVIATRPAARHAYARALLKTQLAPAFLPLGCSWTSRSAKTLGERIALLGGPSPSRSSGVAGAAAVAVVGLALGYAAWAQQPERQVTRIIERPAAVFTPSAEAPEGVLSHKLEAQRHDFFIELAQKGDIDVVFFGTTDSEMWWWPDRGRSVWDRTFASVKATNFGSQGTQPNSLLWRMRNGELDGYQAKLVVLQTPLRFVGGQAIPEDRVGETVTSLAPLIAEIRARQPKAKILLSAPFPRGQTDRESWRPIAKANAAVFAEFVDNKTVFYDDIGERFYRADGSHNQQLWRFPPVSGLENVGMQTPAFQVWSEELQPWLDRFVR